MTIETAIRLDHSQLLKLAKSMSQTKDPKQARVDYATLKRLLVAHSGAEEAVVYRTLDKLGIEAVREATQEGEVEHSLCDHLMALLARGRAESPRWRARAKVVYELLEHHIEEEHKEMLPLLAKHLDAETRIALTKRFETRKAAIAA